MITLDMAWCAENELVSINGTRGRIDYHNNRTLTLASAAGPFSGRVISCTGEPQQLEIVPPELGDASNPLNQHRAFLEAARDGKPAPVSIRSGVDDMRVVAALYQQLK
jgi:predicted dehydrogenase